MIRSSKADIPINVATTLVPGTQHGVTHICLGESRVRNLDPPEPPVLAIRAIEATVGDLAIEHAQAFKVRAAQVEPLKGDSTQDHNALDFHGG